MFESAVAILSDATAEERALLIDRARELAAQGGSAEGIAFSENIGENLGLDEEE